MTLIASILILALTRAEIIERFRTPPVTQLDGLVQVFADCPADMRREYQSPVASFVSDVCETLYRTYMIKPQRFNEPGIVVHIGGMETSCQQVDNHVDETVQDICSHGRQQSHHERQDQQKHLVAHVFHAPVVQLP